MFAGLDPECRPGNFIEGVYVLNVRDMRHHIFISIYYEGNNLI